MPIANILLRMAPFVVVPVVERILDKVISSKQKNLKDCVETPVTCLPMCGSEHIIGISDEELIRLIRQVPWYKNASDDEVKMLAFFLKKNVKF